MLPVFEYWMSIFGVGLEDSVEPPEEDPENSLSKTEVDLDPYDSLGSLGIPEVPRYGATEELTKNDLQFSQFSETDVALGTKTTGIEAAPLNGQ